MSKRHRQSGFEYRKQRMRRQDDNERLAETMKAFLSRDTPHSTDADTVGDGERHDSDGSHGSEDKFQPPKLLTETVGLSAGAQAESESDEDESDELESDEHLQFDAEAEASVADEDVTQVDLLEAEDVENNCLLYTSPSPRD